MDTHSLGRLHTTIDPTLCRRMWLAHHFFLLFRSKYLFTVHAAAIKAVEAWIVLPFLIPGTLAWLGLDWLGPAVAPLCLLLYGVLCYVLSSSVSVCFGVRINNLVCFLHVCLLQWMGIFNIFGPLVGLPFVTGSLPHSPQFIRAVTVFKEVNPPDQEPIFTDVDTTEKGKSSQPRRRKKKKKISHSKSNAEKAEKILQIERVVCVCVLIPFMNERTNEYMSECTCIYLYIPVCTCMYLYVPVCMYVLI